MDPHHDDTTIHDEELPAPNRKRTEVVDPITHLPITIHDHDSVELERIPKPSSQAHVQADDDEQDDEDEKQRRTNDEHGTMQSLVNAETRGYWRDDQSLQSRRRVHTLIIAAASGAIGTLSGFVVAFLLVGLNTGVFVKALTTTAILAGATAFSCFAWYSESLMHTVLDDAGPQENRQEESHVVRLHPDDPVTPSTGYSNCSCRVTSHPMEKTTVTSRPNQQNGSTPC
jgi:hypothetical protein